MAAPTATVELIGGRKFRKEMRQAGLDLADLKEVHALVSRVVLQAGKSAAPVRSGKLAGSHKGSATVTKAEVKAGGAKVPYANPIHWGWPARNIAGNPWLSKAAQRTEPTWIRFYQEDMNDAISKVKGASV